MYWPTALSLCLNFQSRNNIKWQSSVHQCCVLRPRRSRSETPLDGSNDPLKTLCPPLPFRQKSTCIWCMRLCMNLLPSECFFRCLSIKWICPEFSMLEGNESLSSTIFNLSVFPRVGLNGFQLTGVKMLTPVSVLYYAVDIHCYICSTLKLLLSARLFFFLPPTSWLCLQIGQHYTMSYAGQNNIWQFSIQQTTHTEAIWIFCPWVDTGWYIQIRPHWWSHNCILLWFMAHWRCNVCQSD